jgi:large subunit ribosomal protein L9
MPSVKLILLDDVKDLGLAGDEVNVSSGYARNFLIPQKKAVKASPGALRQIAARKEKIEAQRQDELASAQKLAEQIANTEISISMQASEDDQLYGSVTERIIEEAYAANGIRVDHQKIRLEEPIRQLGMFTFDIKLHVDVTAQGKVWVVRA